MNFKTIFTLMVFVLLLSLKLQASESIPIPNDGSELSIIQKNRCHFYWLNKEFDLYRFWDLMSCKDRNRALNGQVFWVKVSNPSLIKVAELGIKHNSNRYLATWQPPLIGVTSESNINAYVLVASKGTFISRGYTEAQAVLFVLYLKRNERVPKPIQWKDLKDLNSEISKLDNDARLMPDLSPGWFLTLNSDEEENLDIYLKGDNMIIQVGKNDDDHTLTPLMNKQFEINPENGKLVLKNGKHQSFVKPIYVYDLP